VATGSAAAGSEPGPSAYHETAAEMVAAREKAAVREAGREEGREEATEAATAAAVRRFPARQRYLGCMAQR